MSSRAAASLLTVATVAFAAPAYASSTPQAPGSAAPQMTEVNRRLAAIVVTPVRTGRQTAQAPGPSALQPSASRSPSSILTPALINAAARFTKAEHLLHFQGHGLDANFWGAFNGGRGVHVRYVIHF